MKRVFELEVGDIFIRCHIEVVVIKILNGQLYYKYASTLKNGRIFTIGAKSQERVKYLGKRLKTKRYADSDNYN